jgi:maltose O-acetyltransferase
MAISKLAELHNSKVLSENISIEDGTKLTDTHIEGKEVIVESDVVLNGCKIFSDGKIFIGKNSVIKENTIINAFNSVSIGARTIIDRDVFVGGMQSEKSELEIGNDCVILYRSYLNTTRKISIGNNVGIGGYCLIFTHSAWLNSLEGNPYKFASVEIKDNVWIPWNVTIFPDVIIGEGVIVGGGAVVTKSLPDGAFAAGVPAKIIRINDKSSKILSKDKKNAIILDILSDFHGYVSDFLKIANNKYTDHHNFRITFEKTRLVYTLDFDDIAKTDTIISFLIPPQIKREYDWIELDTLTSQTSNDIATHFIDFIKRYGIKIKK